MLRKLVSSLLRKLYKIEIVGLENYEKAGDRVLIVANHLSFLDALLLAVFLPHKPMFAINTFIAQKWWLKPFFLLANAFPLDPTNPMATKALISEIRKDRKCVIFPEGRITVTGALMKVYEGPGMIADKSGSMILPIRLDGAQYTPMSRLKGKVRTRWFPKITIQILEPRSFDVPKELKGRARRAAMGQKLYDLMADMMFETSPYKNTLFQGLIDAQVLHGKNHEIIGDVERKPLSYKQLIQRAFILGQNIAGVTKPGEYVGVLLPNMVNTIAVFFGLQAFGRVPAMLNFSTGLKNMLAACQTAEISYVITSRRFIEMGKLEDVAEGIKNSGVNLIYLEDLKAEIGILDKIKGYLASWFPQSYYNNVNDRKPDDAAVVIFTSGSEGVPKGVVLSHVNIQANRYQLSSCIDFGPADKVFNALPIFHSFGLTAGTILPILSGIYTFFYPSPLHYRIVPELVYDTNSTILFGTDTFLSGYARFAHPYDFYSVRYVFSGAEKLKDETRRLYSEKYGVRVLEGYGATETSPALSTNTPMQSKVGSVGRLMPGIKYKLEDVPGIKDGGKLMVQGPNIMKGYLLHDKPGELQPPEGGWYDTGDIVAFDEKGFIEIKGRAKRFAKIAGEMVSLTAAEALACAVYPSSQHAVINIPDARKGEALLLITDCEDIDISDLMKHAKEIGAAELMVPRKLKFVDKLPVLGTGKTDYMRLQEIAKAG